MKLIYVISDPVSELVNNRADICIDRNVINVHSKINPKFFASNVMCEYEYCPHIISNIIWKKSSKYFGKQRYLVIYTLHYYPIDVLDDIINADIVYLREIFTYFLHKIGDECVSFEQLLDELDWYYNFYKKN
jgi:hypothetical protein